ncbi:hypothetical protein [Brevundimonas sp. NIBR11]|uniref:hypothetical protein n=1 Tax=Brevundimonas sp. NIBR11 TaxID=3015999 RepID=UPI0022F11855|nr:hypothetical protein [Brevundimonas sp. NIBR11]WGM31819.1 hypothetical protein KKHFBJBL_02068 [Brevundimonas sp. NIBR11]
MRTAIDKAWVATAIGALALATSGVTAAALAWPESAPGRILNLAPSHEARASRLLGDASPSKEDLAQAQAETMRSLRSAPANATAWLRLAYIDSRRQEGLGAFGIAAMKRSYDAAPYGPDDTAWRLRFALNHWSRLDATTRLLVLNELRFALTHRRAATVQLAHDVSDSAGQVAVSLVLLEAE